MEIPAHASTLDSMHKHAHSRMHSRVHMHARIQARNLTKLSSRNVWMPDDETLRSLFSLSVWTMAKLWP